MSNDNGQLSKGILAIWNDCVRGREADFESWYQGEHLIERLGVPGFLFGQRYEAITATPGYFTYYVTENIETLSSQKYLDRLNNPTPLTTTVMQNVFRNMSRTMCVREIKTGLYRGSVVVTSQFKSFPELTEVNAFINSVSDHTGFAMAELWRGVDANNQSIAKEEQLRGGDEKIEGCLLIETLRLQDAESIASIVRKQFADAHTGVYRVLCQLGNSSA